MTFQETVRQGQGSSQPISVGKFGATLITYPNSIKAVFKYKGFGTDKYRGVPKQELHTRGVAVYRMDRDLLGFNVVPETLHVRHDGREGSLQEYKEGFQARDLVPGVFDKSLPDWKFRVAKLFNQLNLDAMKRIIVLDLICNNTDRHGRNVIVDTHGKWVWAIDNDLSFGPYFKGYRNVFHKYIYLRTFDLPHDVKAVLKGIKEKQISDTIGKLVPKEAVRQTYLRIQFLLEHQDSLAYWNLSHGGLGRDDFPSYERWFKKRLKADPQVSHVMDMNKLPGWKDA